MNEQNLRKAVEEYLSPARTKSLRKIAKEYGVPPTTVHARANGTKLRAEAYENSQAFSKYQEQLLEGYLIYFAQKKDSLERNGGETTSCKFEEQLAIRSHTRAVINKLAPRIFETMQVPKIE